MRIDQDQNLSANQIKQVVSGAINVNDHWYQTSLIVTPDSVETWQPDDIHGLKAHHFDTVIDKKPTIVLLGTGPQLVFPEHAVLKGLKGHFIGVEIMATVAACRTFEALMAEHRDALAALLIP